MYGPLYGPYKLYGPYTRPYIWVGTDFKFYKRGSKFVISFPFFSPHFKKTLEHSPHHFNINPREIKSKTPRVDGIKNMDAH